MTRRDDGAYGWYATEPQRNQPGCIGRQSYRLSPPRTLAARTLRAARVLGVPIASAGVMSWIAVLLLLNQASAAEALSSPSNTPSPSSHRAAVAAEPPRPNEFARPVTIESRFGFGTPVGAFGGAVSYSPIPAFGVDCGAGVNKVGLQLACALLARLVLNQSDRKNSGSLALTLSSGFSTGPFVDNHELAKLTAVDGPGAASRSYQRAYWWNTDVGVEQRYERLVLRVFAGSGMLLNPDAGTDIIVTGNERIEGPSTSLFYLGLGIGLTP